MFSKILIANRGEIAVRIIRACKEMGISTVAVFSEADRDALHVSLADESYCIGPPALKDSYLNISAILSLAASAGAQAIHPGYGLLSENHRFARLCHECGIVFIGPPGDVIRAMGDKDNAKKTMRDAGVPVIPGIEMITDIDAAAPQIADIGYPVLLKARSGGGGRGIRLVTDESQLRGAFAAASAEAQSAFGDGGVYCEKYLSPVKHIEVQLIADNFGNVVSLGERDCSIQRKNQKLIEESPSPVVTPVLRARLNDMASKAAAAVGYTGVGTVEFLMDSENNVYFCEMNTRLQVEHPVTEMVTGIDLVQWQIRVAAGSPLAFDQDDIAVLGHAIECRINAEDPEHGFRPSCGRITLLHVPGGAWVRFDTAIYQDYVIPPFYDSMIGKLIVHASTREGAIRKMRAALCEAVIEGVSSTLDLQLRLLSNEAFVSGTYTTSSLTEVT